jgi:hypothetical protein
MLDLEVTKIPEYCNEVFIYLVTFASEQKARVLHSPRIKMIARNKRSSLIGQFASYEENGVL